MSVSPQQIRMNCRCGRFSARSCHSALQHVGLVLVSVAAALWQGHTNWERQGDHQGLNDTQVHLDTLLAGKLDCDLLTEMLARPGKLLHSFIEVFPAASMQCKLEYFLVRCQDP